MKLPYSILKRSFTDLLPKSGGAGLGNVKNRVLPTRQKGRKLFQHTKSPKTVSIIGAPMTYGQPYVGTDVGPELLREEGLREMLSDLDWRVEDIPDLDFENLAHVTNKPPATFKGNARNHEYVGLGSEMVADAVYSSLSKGRFPLLLGGDHSVGIGSLAAVLKNNPNTGVLWIDAHADLNVPAISESGNMHGMPVGLLMDGVVTDDVYDIPGLEWLRSYPKLKPSSVVYVGLRDVDPAEREIINRLDIQAFTMTEIDHYGIGKVMDMALESLLQDDPGRPLHLSYDIDAIDPIHAPATGTTVRGGLTFREAHYVAEAVALSGNLASADIVELNPTLSHDEGAKETADIGLQIITSFMGQAII